MIIDHNLLSKEALQGAIENFVTIEGTDYGHQEYSLEDKVKQVKQQLINKEVAIIFDPTSETTSIVVMKEALKA